MHAFKRDVERAVGTFGVMKTWALKRLTHHAE
jgi:hypothetical protein